MFNAKEQMERSDAQARFRQARRKALVQEVLGFVLGHPDGLLAFDQVRRKLRGRGQISRGLEEIPLDNIVGSVDRYRDFTRAFLPRESAAATRWEQLDVALQRLETIPPIDVYQIGDVYFVRDGHHRVSVAKAHDLSHISAYVTEIPVKVPIEPDIHDEELLVKAEYADFLDQTELDRLRPEAEIEFSTPGHYHDLIKHIRVYQRCAAQVCGHEKSWEQAVTGWYDTVYRPIVELIRQEHVLHDFPARTEADLYVWIMEHVDALRDCYGPQTDVAAAIGDALRPNSPIERVVRRFIESIGHETSENDDEDLRGGEADSEEVQ